MEKHVLMTILLGFLILSCTSCRQNTKNNLVASSLTLRSVCDQQSEAYPEIADSSYLVIADFEDADQLYDANLYLTKGNKPGASRIFYSGSPTATGEGALGVYFDELSDYRLSYTLSIKKWTTYNLLLVSIYNDDPKTKCVMEISDVSGKKYQKHLLLDHGWNKLKFDLEPVANAIDIGNVSSLNFIFNEIGNTRLYMDDLILLDYHKIIIGELDGKAGSLYAIQEGRQIRIGANRRFELVFASGRWTGWYDLETDEKCQNNLLPAVSRGIELLNEMKKLTASLPADSEITVHTKIITSNRYEICLQIEYFYDEYAMKIGPDEIFTYTIRPDGEILFEIKVRNASEQLAVAFCVASGQGFEPVIGRIRAEDGDGRMEYCLLRRAGKKAGSDLLMAVKPWATSSDPVTCKIERLLSGDMQVIFNSETREGENKINGMMRLWPANIDNLGNAEKYVRQYFSLQKKIQ